MASILILPGTTTGRINTSRRLASQLAERGHAVAIAGPGEIEDRLGEIDAEFLTLPDGPSATEHGADRSVRSRAVRQLSSISRWGRVRDRRRSRLATYGIDEWRAILGDRDPDVVLIDLELPGHVMAALGAGRRVMLWSTMLSVWRRPGLPPLHTSIVPGEGFWGSRVGIRLAWWRFIAWKWIRAQRLWLTRAGVDQRSVMRHAGSVVGFDWSEVDEYEWLLPCTFPGVPTLVFNALELELPHTPHPWVRYVGPFLDRVEVGDEAGSPLIYAGFGAWHRGDDSRVIASVIRAVARHPEWRLVVGLGGRRAPEGLPTAPNVEIRSWAPQAEMLAAASVAIHHAGINSINECIVTETPMLAVPFDYGDTPGAASRVRFHRLGLVADRRDVDEDVVEAAIVELLGDPGYRERLRAMAETFSRYEGRAVAEVEAQLA